MNDLRADQFVKSELLSITKTYVCIPICGTRRKLTVATTIPQRSRLRPRRPSDKFSKWFLGHCKSNRSQSARAPWNSGVTGRLALRLARGRKQKRRSNTGDQRADGFDQPLVA